MKEYQVKLRFIRDIIGSQPADENLRLKYITAKMVTGKTGMSGEVALNKVKEEIENLKKDESYQEKIKEMEEKALTVFHRDAEGKPSMSDVQLRGFFKSAFTFVGRDLKILSKKDGSDYSGDAKYRDWIGNRISFQDQYYPLKGEITLFTRPIRFEYMGKQTSALASSELIKAGESITFTLKTTEDVSKEAVGAILDRGMFRGLGQWANAQYGTFTYEIL